MEQCEKILQANSVDEIFEVTTRAISKTKNGPVMTLDSAGRRTGQKMIRIDRIHQSSSVQAIPRNLKEMILFRVDLNTVVAATEVGVADEVEVEAAEGAVVDAVVGKFFEKNFSCKI